MKKTLLTMLAITVLVLTANLTIAQTYSYPVKGQQGFSLTEKTRDGMRISYELGGFSLNQLNYKGEEMSEITIKGIALPNVAGSPNLPTESRMMAIPQGAKATMNVIRADRQIIKNVNIAPALRIQAENEEPDMDYKKDMKVYSKNAFYPEDPFVMGSSYIRGVDAVTVAITPFQYNPVTKELAVYTNIELSVSYEGGSGHFGEDRLRSPYWDPILAAELMNYDQLPVIDYEARMQEWLRDDAEGAEYLIITPNNDAWAPYAQQLKEYRMKQGILTEVYRLDEMPATTTTAMKQWFHNAYHNWEIAPVAVCLIGDHGSNMSQYIPAEIVAHPYEGTCITDNMYADAQGNDNLPDMVFSRLIAQNESELPIFISKQIEYEYTNPNMDPDFYTSPITALGWQTERWFQLCSEVFGGYMRNHGYTPNRINCIYDGFPDDYWSSAQNTSMPVNYFGPNGTNYIPATPAELGGWDGGSPEQVVQAVNNGSFWLQHRDHGLENGWGEPAMRNSHVAQTNNVGKLPFVMSINCLTGKFNYGSTCFCEAWMRHTYNGQNAGAVGVLCPTEISYSFVNDAFVWGVYDLFDGDFMPTLPTSNYTYGPATSKTGNWMPAFGNVAGKYFLYNCSWPYNEEDKDITYTMFTAHCDAFLRIYTQVPQDMVVNHQNVQIAGQQIFQITAPEGATVALTKGEGENLEIVAVAQATGGIQNITIPAQIPPTILKLTVTGQNYLRYEADIEVIPDDGPYIIINNYSLLNQATQLNFDTQSGFNLVFKNVGNSQAPAGTATLTSTSEYITITNGTVNFNAIESNNTLTLDNAFTFRVSDEVPNKTNIEFIVSISSGNDIYESHINMKAYAPVFKIGTVSIQEISGNSNGRLDPGETVNLVFPIENKGKANSRETDVTLTMKNAFLFPISSTNTTVNSIEGESTTNIEFQVYVGNAPSGYSAAYTLDVADGVYTDTRDFSSKIGLNVEDFEQAVIDPALWTNVSAFPWGISTESPYEGNYCIKSGPIRNNLETEITLTYEAGESDSIAFHYRVSSEYNYDKLYFYIDNQERSNWSGEIPWSKAQYYVNAGTHTFKWKYKKDVSMDSGDDCAWIDFVTLPRDISLAASAGLDIDICEGEDAHILGYAANFQSIHWTTSGDGTFSNPTIAEPIYTPGPQDLANGSVTLTITVNGENNASITDDMTVTINAIPVIENALTNMHYCAIDEPQAIAVTITGNYHDFKWTTSGDGTFADPHALETTYTPGIQDITNGVTITAFVTAAGCDPIEFAYPFDMSPTPYMNMPLPGCVIMACQGQDFSLSFADFSGYVNGQMTMDVNGETVTLTEGQPLVLPTANLEVGNHSFEFHNLSNGICEFDPNTIIEIQVLEAPNLTVNNAYLEICEGETASFEFIATGGDTESPSYTITGNGIEPIAFTGSSFTYELNTTESTDIHLTGISSEISGCGDPCETDLDITLIINVVPNGTAPKIIGDTDVDVSLTPVTTYTIENIRAHYSLSPLEAGTIIDNYDDGKTIDIQWSNTFKVNAILTASPVSECTNTETTLSITVRNTTGVEEIANNAKLYPNPTSENVNIECKGMTHVSVFSMIGQRVYDADVNTDKLSIDMAQFPAGSYLVRITTSNGTVVKNVMRN